MPRTKRATLPKYVRQWMPTFRQEIAKVIYKAAQERLQCDNLFTAIQRAVNVLESSDQTNVNMLVMDMLKPYVSTHEFLQKNVSDFRSLEHGPEKVENHREFDFLWLAAVAAELTHPTPNYDDAEAA